jgi:hypothetical protein
MSFNNIQLPGIVIAGLYKKGIIQGEPETVAATAPAVAPVATAPVQPAEVTTASPSPAAATYKLLGNNRQQVVIVVRFPGEVFLPESHLQMLTKMLGACKLNLGDVAIVNEATQGIDINLLKEQLHPKKLLLFGVTPEETGLPLNFPPFKDQEYAGCVYLCAPGLDQLNMDNEEGKTLKKKLWESLKKLFGV